MFGNEDKQPMNVNAPMGDGTMTMRCISMEGEGQSRAEQSYSIDRGMLLVSITYPQAS